MFFLYATNYVLVLYFQRLNNKCSQILSNNTDDRVAKFILSYIDIMIILLSIWTFSLLQNRFEGEWNEKISVAFVEF